MSVQKKFQGLGCLAIVLMLLATGLLPLANAGNTRVTGANLAVHDVEFAIGGHNNTASFSLPNDSVVLAAKFDLTGKKSRTDWEKNYDNRSAFLRCDLTNLSAGYDSIALNAAPFISPEGGFDAFLGYRDPYGTATGDFDGDGQTDIAVSYFQANRTGFFPRKSDGAFRSFIEVPSSTGQPAGIAAGDVNSDGLTDLVVAEFLNNRIAVFTQNPSTHQLDPAVTYGTTSRPIDVVLGDFNNDLHTDVAAVTGFSSTCYVNVLEQNSVSHLLNASVQYALGGTGTATSIAAGELSGDFCADIVAVSDGNVSYLVQQSGGLAAPVTVNLPAGRFGGGVAIGDLNISSAGNEVLVGVNGTGQQGFFIYNQTGGTLGAVYSYIINSPGNRPAPLAVGAGDINSDGRADAVIGLNGPRGNITVRPQNSDGTLGAPISYPVSDDLRAVAFGDIDGDGRTDLACCGRMPDGAVVLWQNASGGLGSRTDFRYETTCIASGDLDADGRTDFVFSARYSSRLGVLYRQPMGGYGPLSILGPCDDPSSLAIGDVTGDNLQDIVVTARGNDTLAVLERGVGAFLAPVYTKTGKSPACVALGDVTGDNITDAVIAHSQETTITVLRQTSPGGLVFDANYTIGNGQSSVVIADLNSDLKKDVAVSRIGAGAVDVLNQTNNGKLASPATYSVGTVPVALAAGDINTDGLNDLVVASAQDQQVNCLVQNSAGGLDRKSDIGLAARPLGVAVADLGADGRPDLLVWQSNGNISLYRQDNSGGFLRPMNYSSEPGPSMCAVADIDRDTRMDLGVVGPMGMFRPLVLQDIVAGSGRGYPSDPAPVFLKTADLNRDGAPDLVAASNDRITVFIQSPGGGLSPGQSYAYPGTGAGVTGLGIGDINSDGWPEVAVTQYGWAGAYILYGSPGGNLAPPQWLSVPGSWGMGVALADVTGEGRSDLVFCDWNRLWVFPQTAGGTLGGAFQVAGMMGMRGLSPGDVNSDGRTDIVCEFLNNNAIGVFIQNAWGSLDAPVQYTADNWGWTQWFDAVAIGDVNGDGRNDVCVLTRTNNILDVFTQKNDGTLNDKVTYQLYANDAGGPGIAIGDFDGDLKNEVAVSNSASTCNNITILDQDAQGKLFEKTSYRTGTNPHQMVAADLNSDGTTDIAVVNGGSNNLSVYYQLHRNGTLTVPPATVPAYAAIESVNLTWTEVMGGPGTKICAFVSTNSTVWSEVKNATRFTFPASTQSVFWKLEFTSESTFIPAISTLHAVYTTTAYPSDPSCDIGGDGTVEWNRTGRYNWKETMQGDFVVSALNSYLNGHRNQAGPLVDIPVDLYSSNEGTITISNISIDYDQPPFLVEPIPDLGLDEDTANPELLALNDYISDDFDKELSFEIINSTNSSIVYCAIVENSWLSVDAATGMANDNWTGQVSLALKVTDGTNLSLIIDPLIITVRGINDAPVIVSSPVNDATVGVPYTYPIKASDAENASLRYILDKGLAGMELNSTTGVLTWVPRKEQLDLPDRRVGLRVFDGVLYSVSQEYRINLRPNLPPVINSTPPVKGFVGEQYAYLIIASDPENGNLSYTLMQKPVGMTINETAGAIQWVPAQDQLGINPVQVLVSDGYNPVIQNFNIEVREKPVANRAPVILSFAVLNATVNQTYTYSVIAYDDDKDTLAYSLDSRPQGMTIDNTIGRISWSPVPGQAGNHTVIVRVGDGTVNITQTFTIRVKSDYIQPPPPKPPTPQIAPDYTWLWALSGVVAVLGVLAFVFLYLRQKAPGPAGPRPPVAASRPARAQMSSRAQRPAAASPVARMAAHKAPLPPADEPEEDEDVSPATIRAIPPPEPAEHSFAPSRGMTREEFGEDVEGDDEAEVVDMDEEPAPENESARPPGPAIPTESSGGADKKAELDSVFRKLGADKPSGAVTESKAPKKGLDKSIEEILGLRP